MKLPIVIQENNNTQTGKRFSAFIDGIDQHIDAEADSKEKLLNIITEKIEGLEQQMLDTAKENWQASNITITQIEY